MKKNSIPRIAAAACLALSLPALADGPKDNAVDNVRAIPPPGTAPAREDAEALTKELADLRQAINAAAQAQAKNPQLADLLPDVEIFYKSVDWAMRYNQFYNMSMGKPGAPAKGVKDIRQAKDVKSAHEQIAEGMARAAALKAGKAPWTQAKGLVVRAYRSKIDGSIQPYGMIIPESYSGAPTRLDFWIHGRGETLSELSFLDQRMHSAGQVVPANTLVLHPYGRYCCANKFAGEVDLFEALAHARKSYKIDPNRIMMRGFSMGGAAAWQFSTHFADHWCACNPGAGFAETPEFLKLSQNQELDKVPWYEKTLWHWYNSSDYAVNLFNSPTIAYNGDIDAQRQAADVMEREMKKEGLDLVRIIGPHTAHKIHPDSLVEIEKRLADIAVKGRRIAPREVRFTTWTLVYNHMEWITVDGMGEEWERARVDANVKGDSSGLELKTQNVTALTLNFAPGECPLDPQKEATVTIDGKTIPAAKVVADRPWKMSFNKLGDVWALRQATSPATVLAKRHGLSGPIDDAFMSAFVFVTPTGKGMNKAVDAWVAEELHHATTEWQKQFRGIAPAKADTKVTPQDIANRNLVLWGDPSSNAFLKKIADRLPVKWTAEGIEIGAHKYAAGDHVPVLIYPNPLNPKRYVVINSSFTYREFDYLNNARQVPRLPDWAIINLSEPPNAVLPGKIEEAGFFDEAWKVKAQH